MNQELSAPVLDSIQGTSAAVARMLQGGEIEEATRLFDRAFRRWPKSVKLRLLKGELLARISGRSQAAIHYAGMLNAVDVSQWAAGRLLAVLHEEQLPIDDALVVARYVCDAGIDAKLKERILDRLLERKSPAEHERLLEVLGVSAGVIKYELKLAIKRSEKDEFDTALALLETAHNEGRSTVQAAILLSDLYGLCSRLPDAVSVLEGLLRQYPEQPDIYRRLTSLLQRARDFSRAADVFEEAARRWPLDWMLLFRLNRLPIERRRLARVFDVFAASADKALAENERFRFHFALSCLHCGQVDRGYELLRQQFCQPVDSQAAPVLKALGARSMRGWVSGSRLVDNRTREVQVTRTANARATVVLTTGIAFGYLPLALVDTLFAQHGVNVIYVRDFGIRACLRGVPSLGRNEDETVAALLQLKAKLGAARTIVMGSSSGGFTALRYGCLMQADFAISFSGQSALATYHASTRRSVWNPNFFVNALLERESDLPLDLVPILAKPSRTRFRQYFGENAAEDARQARRLEGLPGVEVIPVSGVSDHYVLDHMIGDGSFDALLAELAGT